MVNKETDYSCAIQEALDQILNTQIICDGYGIPISR